MSALARIKKTAAQHEQERQYDKALALYARLLDGAEAGDEEVDVGLFNRAGDLALRLGDAPRAVGYFERALDLYAAGGLLNNAVALGVKILRHAPNHLSAHYTLGVLYGRKGFRGDARHHMLTYAVQMQRAGRTDEAERTLVEVAAACGDPAALRAAVDAYGALGGDPAQGAALMAAAVDGETHLARATPTAAAPSVGSALLIDYAPTHAPAPDLIAPARHDIDLPLAAPAADVAPDDVALGWEPLPPPATVVEHAEPGAPDSTLAWSAIDLGAAAESALEPACELPGEWSAAPTFDPTRDDQPVDTNNGSSALVFLDMADEASSPEQAAGHPVPDEAPTWSGGVIDFTDDRTSVHATAAAPRWADALPGDPPPLRLGELAHVVAGEPSAVPLPYATPEAAPVTPGRSVADGHFADLLAVELAPADVEPDQEADVASEPAAPAATRYAPPAAPAADAAPIDLGAWLRDTTPAASTRLTTPVVPQSGDEQADFDATLRAFTSGVARAVEHEDFDSHYDLGVAFREMGLLDEAIVEFQRAALAPGRPLRALETLAQCFLDAGQPELALTTLHEPAAAAVASGVGDASLVAVHYLMGAAAEALGRRDDARRWFVRVVATDFRFRDATSRLAALPPPTPVR